MDEKGISTQARLSAHRNAEIDAAYAAYDEHPLDEPDEWGDLASFHEAASKSRPRANPAVRGAGC